MPNGSNNSPLSRVWRLIGVVFVGAIALSIVVEVVKASWGWLLVIAGVLAVLCALGIAARWWLRRRNW